MYIRLAASLCIFFTFVAIGVLGGLTLQRDRGPDGDIASLADTHSFDLVRWEITNFPAKILYKVGHLFNNGPSEKEKDAVLHRYFALARQIAEGEGQASQPRDAATAAADRNELRRLENQVEDILEGRITQLLKEEGLTLSPPLFRGMVFVFPPVDFELDDPPKVLAISPRNRIKLSEAFLLKGNLTGTKALRLEEGADATGVSSLVINVGGVATYPSTVPFLGDYPTLVDIVIHEWLHQFLALHPLGRNFFRNEETRTLNETVANMAAAELAEIFLSRYPSLERPPTLTPRTSDFDFAQEMRELRVQVELFLQQGNIEAAEGLMEAKRLLFQTQGVYIRKINQAYFAFNNFYADTPASINPIGPKLRALREKIGSLSEFVRIAAGITSAKELDDILSRLGASSETRGPESITPPIDRGNR